MPATLEEFKGAFGVSASDDLLTRRDEQTATALKTLKSSVAGLKDGDAAKRHKDKLVELVRHYEGVKKRANRPRSEIVADLEGVCRAVLAQLSELKQAASATPSGSAAGAPADAPAGNGKPVVATQRPTEDGDQPSKKPPQTETEVVEDRRRELKQARAAWVAVKTRAEEDLEKVKDGARREYLADPEQFPKVVQGCKAIDEILDSLDDELRDTLDQYVSTPARDQRKLISLAASANEVLDRYLDFVAGHSLMKAIDKKEFADVTVHAPVMKALRDLKRAIA